MTTIHMYSDDQEIYWDCPYGIEDVFKQPGATLFVRNQGEKDYYGGLQFMYSQPINILTMDEYMAELNLAHDDPYFVMPRTYYSTYQVLKTY